jgi:ANTAR domain/GAF domain
VLSAGDARMVRLWELVTGCADGEVVSAAHVCDAAVEGVGVDGAALSLGTRLDRRQLVHATDRVAALLDEQQLTLGEGPCVEVWSSRGQVLASDLSSPGSVIRWPVFAPAAEAAGARAVFTFPLQMGAIRLGALELYRAKPGPLGGEQIADALTLCRAAVAVILATDLSPPLSPPNGAQPAPQPPWPLGGPDQERIAVYQATGMVAVQLGTGLQDAFARLRAHAFAQGIPLARVARQVVDRYLRFHPDDFDQS